MYDQFEFEREFRDAHLSGLHHSEAINAKMSNWCKDAKNIFFWGGKAGNGKTYFCAAFLNHLREQKKNVRVYSESHLLDELKMCMNAPGDSPTHRIRVICEVEYLILDDMASGTLTEWQKEVLFSIVDKRYSNCLPTLITSNLNRSEVKEKFHERFASRLFAMKNTLLFTDEPDRRQDPRFSGDKS